MPGLTTAAQYSGSPLPLPMRVSAGIAVTDLCGNTRMYSRPSPRTECVAVIRPASMASALSQPPSRACRPNSPKVTVLPRVALPFTLPRWLFRNFTRLGMSGIACLLGVQVVPVVDPDLDADVALGGLGLGEPVLDPGPQRGQRDAAGHVALGPGHLGPAQPPGQLDADPLGAGLHRLVQGALERAPETGPLLQLLGDVLGHQLRIHLRPVDLHRLDLDVAVGQVLQLVRELIDLLALLADDDADAGRVDVDHDLLARPLDADARDAGVAVAPLDVLADLHVLDQQLGEVLLAGEPAAQPVRHDPGAEPGGPNFLPHVHR